MKAFQVIVYKDKYNFKISPSIKLCKGDTLLKHSYKESQQGIYITQELLQRTKCSLMRKLLYIVPKYPHSLAVWTKFEDFISKYFAKKRENQLIRGKLSSLLLG